jgi:hypothetical protein
MQLVDRLTAAWGVIPDLGGGKTVWFEFAPADPDAAPDGDVDVDALLDSFDDPGDVDPGPPATLRLPDTDTAYGTRRRHRARGTPAGGRRRVRAAT